MCKNLLTKCSENDSVNSLISQHFDTQNSIIFILFDCMNVVNNLVLLLFSFCSSYRIANNNMRLKSCA